VGNQGEFFLWIRGKGIFLAQVTPTVLILGKAFPQGW